MKVFLKQTQKELEIDREILRTNSFIMSMGSWVLHSASPDRPFPPRIRIKSREVNGNLELFVVYGFAFAYSCDTLKDDLNKTLC